MRNASRVLRLGIATVAVLASMLLHARAQAGAPPILALRLDGVVDPFVASYITSSIDGAQDSDVSAILLTIDTPGGLDSSMRDIVQSISNSDLPVLCYVSPEGARAASAGTFIMMACPVAAMAPGTAIGAAHPVGISGVIEQEKVTNDAVALIRSLAERNGRNADWAESAVRDSVSISADSALEQNVIDLVAPTTAALFDEIDGTTVKVGGGRTTVLQTAGAPVEDESMGIGAQILHSLFTPDLAFILFYAGIALIVIELLHPGISVPGIAGVLSLLTSFVSFGMLPVQLTGIVLLLASAIFFLLELKHPGVGVATVGGVATLVLGGLFLFNRSVPDAAVSPWTIVPVAAAATLFFGMVVSAAVRARHLPPGIGLERLVGTAGTVKTDLDPQGVVQVASEEWSASSPAGLVPKGTTVRVVGVEGLRLVVEPAVSGTPGAAGEEEGRQA